MPGLQVGKIIRREERLIRLPYRKRTTSLKDVT
jgi:hypothetical protein